MALLTYNCRYFFVCMQVFRIVGQSHKGRQEKSVVGRWHLGNNRY